MSVRNQQNWYMPPPPYVMPMDPQFLRGDKYAKAIDPYNFFENNLMKEILGSPLDYYDEGYSGQVMNGSRKRAKSPSQEEEPHQQIEIPFPEATRYQPQIAYDPAWQSAGGPWGARPAQNGHHNNNGVGQHYPRRQQGQPAKPNIFPGDKVVPSMTSYHHNNNINNELNEQRGNITNNRRKLHLKRFMDKLFESPFNENDDNVINKTMKGLKAPNLTDFILEP